MKRAIVGLALVLALSVGHAWAEEPALAPFPTAWEDQVGGPADLSFLLDAPAGRDGFVTVREGHLAQADATRFRIWGINLSAAGGLPLKKDAPRLAAILARHGLNGVRFHYIDRPAPGGILDASRSDTRALDPEQVDLTHFDERLIELQKDYARRLLTHRNPYTGAEYRNEPAVAIVEMVNENSIVESWFSGRLLGKNETKNPGTWTDIPASYERELTARYQAWLRGGGLPDGRGGRQEAPAALARGRIRALHGGRSRPGRSQRGLRR
jgi:hypothetical protein